MNKYLYTTGTLALALVLSGLPAVQVHAEDTVTSDEAVTTTVNSGTPRPRAEKELELLKKQAEKMRELKQGRPNEVTSDIEKTPLNEQQRELLKKQMEQARQGEVASSSLKEPINEQEREQMKQQAERVREEGKQQFEQMRETIKDRLEFLREGTTTPARSIEQLKQMIESRRMEIRDGLASTSPSDKKAFEHASQVSVAVHALLSSKDLLGEGIGQQVSDIARKVDDSMATTTNAETRIQSRGFFSKLFFGGDKESAQAISEQALKNQTHLQELTSLLSSASTTEEVKTTLAAQVQAMKDEQVRLQGVAKSESKLWGLFSWRF